MKRRSIGVLIAASILFAGGCLHSRVAEEWGEAHEHNRVEQVADPSAPRHGEGPRGLDPVTAEEVADRYYETQTSQPTRRSGPALLIQGAGE